MKTLLCLAVLAVVGAADAVALTVTVRSNDESSAPAPAVPVVLRRVDREEAERTMQLPLNASTVLNVGSIGTWEINVGSSTHWAAPVYASATDAVTLSLWRVGNVHGQLGGRPPASGELIVTFAPSADGEAGPAGTIRCPFSGRDWQCPLPAGVLDIKFNVTGYATDFKWAVPLSAEGLNIGRIELTPGSSLSGNVDLAAGTSQPTKPIEVALTAVNPDPSARRTREFRTQPDRKGFFQIRGLAPGAYTLRASAGVDFTSDVRPVEIVHGTNATLKEPLLLAKPVRFSVRITPPLDPAGGRWQVELLQLRHGAVMLDAVAKTHATAAGEWSLNRVQPGEYRLAIHREDGSEWSAEELTIRAADPDKSIDIVLANQRVKGQVLLGERPIAARVRFGDENGPALIADERGRFEGVFPPFEEAGQVSLLVTADTPDVQRTLKVKAERSPDGELFFNVRLPATTILGRAINEDGSPEPSAIITLSSRGGEDVAFEQIFVEKDGSFQFEGFEPGTYSLQADAFLKLSELLQVDARTEPGPSHDLVLRPLEEVRGRVTMNGVPVEGAEVYAFPRDTKATLLPTGKSDATGLFVITLPPGTKTYDAIVIPRGFYMTAARITRVPREGLNVGVGQDGGSLNVDAPDDNSRLLLMRAGGEFSLPWLARSSGGTIAAADGRRQLTVLNLEPGPYSVCREVHCTAVHVPRYASASVTID
jgi:hypothetical protein